MHCERRRRERRNKDKMFEEIMVENFPNLKKDKNFKIQEEFIS